MKKKIICLICLCLVIFSTSSYAADNMDLTISNVIAGDQNYLVFANIIERGSSAYSVEVMETIGSAKDGDNSGEKNNSSSEKDIEDISGKIIEVEGLNSYMFYDGYEYQPKKGDNVLLSLKFNGNLFSVKNGAYRVDYASHDNFNFIIPESSENIERAANLTALYLFVRSDGLKNDYTVKNSAVYTYDEKAREKIIKDRIGIKFIDEYGKTTNEASSEQSDMNEQKSANEYPFSWLRAGGIIIAGALIGFFVVKLIIKIEKRYEI